FFLWFVLINLCFIGEIKYDFSATFLFLPPSYCGFFQFYLIICNKYLIWFIFAGLYLLDYQGVSDYPFARFSGAKNGIILTPSFGIERVLMSFSSSSSSSKQRPAKEEDEGASASTTESIRAG